MHNLRGKSESNTIDQNETIAVEDSYKHPKSKEGDGKFIQSASTSSGGQQRPAHKSQSEDKRLPHQVANPNDTIVHESDNEKPGRAPSGQLTKSKQKASVNMRASISRELTTSQNQNSI